MVHWSCWCSYCLHEASWEGLRAEESWFVPQSQQKCLKMEAGEAVEGRQSLHAKLHKIITL